MANKKHMKSKATFSMSFDTLEKLDEHCEMHGIKKSRFVEIAIHEKLRNDKSSTQKLTRDG